MPHLLVSSAFVMVCLLLPTVSEAQSPTEAEKQDARDRLEPALVDPAAAPLRAPLPQFTFLAEKGKQEVKGTIGLDIGDTSAYLELAGPIAEDATEASPLTLSGLANGARVTFGLSRNRLFLPVSTELLDAMEQFCKSRRIDPCAMSRTKTVEDRRDFMARFLRRVPTFYGLTATLNQDEFEFLSADLRDDLSDSHWRRNDSFCGRLVSVSMVSVWIPSV